MLKHMELVREGAITHPRPEEQRQGEVAAALRAMGDPRGGLRLGAVAFRGEMQPLRTCRPAGRKSGDKYSALSLFLSSHLCFRLLFANPARRQKARSLSSRVSFLGAEQSGGASSQVRDAPGSGTGPEKCGRTLLPTAVCHKSVCILKKEENLVELDSLFFVREVRV